jgi:hypothetical protein
LSVYIPRKALKKACLLDCLVRVVWDPTLCCGLWPTCGTHAVLLVVVCALALCLFCMWKAHITRRFPLLLPVLWRDLLSSYRWEAQPKSSHAVYICVYLRKCRARGRVLFVDLPVYVSQKQQELTYIGRTVCWQASFMYLLSECVSVLVCLLCAVHTAAASACVAGPYPARLRSCQPCRVPLVAVSSLRWAGLASARKSKKNRKGGGAYGLTVGGFGRCTN